MEKKRNVQRWGKKGTHSSLGYKPSLGRIRKAAGKRGRKKSAEFNSCFRNGIESGVSGDECSIPGSNRTFWHLESYFNVNYECTESLLSRVTLGILFDNFWIIFYVERSILGKCKIAVCFH